MENNIKVYSIGNVQVEGQGYQIKIDEPYRRGLKNIIGFTNLQVIWWGNLFDNPKNRQDLICHKPYKKSPEELGVFATRSQIRPNPILITTIFVIDVDEKKGIIRTPYIDAEDGTPVLDIKPYHKLERVEGCEVPEWCAHWPEWYEGAGVFNWEEEFNF